MIDNADNNPGRLWSRLRVAGWLTAAAILLIPLIAMQFTDEVTWNLGDFAVAGILIVGTGVAFELAIRRTGSTAYRAASAVTLGAALLLMWSNLAVGLIGSEDNPANLMYLVVLAVGFTGALLSRFRPDGMARALFATAAAQTIVAVIALLGDLGAPWTGPTEIVFLNGFFVALWIVGGMLFRSAQEERETQGATR